MRYPYFDILIDMAKANVAPTGDHTLHHYKDSISNTTFGPKLSSKTLYTNPDGRKELKRIEEEWGT